MNGSQNGMYNFVMNCLQQRMGMRNIPTDRNGNIDFQQIVTQLVQSGQMSQEQFNQFSNQANQMRNMFGKH